MRISLGDLAARLERGIGEEVLRRAAERGAGVLAEGVRARLSEAPGGAHDTPWVESGRLRDSIGVAAEGDADGMRAVVGSSDPAAVPQELGTVHAVARPFFAPAAAEMGEEAARVVGAVVMAGLRGEEAESGDEGGEAGIIQASAAGDDLDRVLPITALVLLYYWLYGRSADPSRTIAPSGPTIVEQSPPEDKKDAPPANLAKPGEAKLSDRRRRHILDGDRKGGGHGPGRNTPGKSNFPSDWSDDKTIEAILDVANDPASSRGSGDDGRTLVTGTRDGVDIEVVIDKTGKSVISAYPKNTPRNPRR